MRDRPVVQMKPVVRRTTLAVDVVVLSPRSDALAVLLVRSPAGARERWSLPWDAPAIGEALEDAAARIAGAVLGSVPAFFEQVGTLSDGRRHPGDAEVSVGIAALSPAGSGAPSEEAEWFPLASLPTLAPRHRTIVDRAAAVVRQRVDQSPLAFRLLPPTFTLSDLQSVYELLLSRRLHKASFRRALRHSSVGSTR
jgi:8-oxo-dGTP diphosphatase